MGDGLAAVAGIVSLVAGVLVLTHEPAVLAEPFGPTATAEPTQLAPAPDTTPETSAVKALAESATEPPARSSDEGNPVSPEARARGPVAVPPREVSFVEAGVVVPVVPMGVLASGALQIPHDPSRIGWWAAGAMPGDTAGSVVLAGHMDGLSHGGAMSVLLDVTAGDVVALQDRHGATHRYRIVARDLQPRQSIDPGLFTTNGPTAWC